MKLKIIGYESATCLMCHECKDENGKKFYADIMVDSGIDVPEEMKETQEKYTQFCRSLIGKEIECSSTSPFLSVAHNVKLL